MTLTVTSTMDSAVEASSECMVVFASEEGLLPGQSTQVDEAIGGAVAQRVEAGDLVRELGKSVVLYDVDGVAADRLMAVYVPALELADRKFIGLANTVAKALQSARLASASICLEGLSVVDRDIQWISKIFTEALMFTGYKFNQYKEKKAESQKLENLCFLVADEKTTEQCNSGIEQGIGVGKGVALARDLGNMPPNDCHPTYLAEKAESMAAASDKLKTTVLNEEEMRELGMNSLLSVGQGSDQPTKLIIMEYTGGEQGEAPYALVGKGVTFDTGGISLKPGPKMDEMKFDMCGAASVFGALESVLELQLPINLICAVAAVENMPSSNASRPGDIVTSMSGKTIEILNTDAEGRLALCDALTYVQKYQPKTIIDIATLTGACIMALGHHASGLYSNDEQLGSELEAAGLVSGDRAWRMPLWDDYTKQLKSPFADLANIGTPGAGSVTAACFLAEFVKEQKWAHLDVAGTASTSGSNKGATGRPVGLLVEYLIDQAQQAGLQ